MNTDTNHQWWLVGVDDGGKAIRLPIKAPILVGRGPYNHLVLDDTRVSWQHARIAPQNDGALLVVHDLNSRNGTTVNGQGGVTRTTLQPNDVVCFGSHSFRIEHTSPFDDERGQRGQRSQRDKRDKKNITPFDPEGATLGEVGNVGATFADAAHPDDGDGDDDPSTGELPRVNLNQLEDAHQKLGTLYSFIQAICKTIDKRELLALICGKTREVYSASSVGIYLRSESGKGNGRYFQLAHWLGDTALQPASTLPEDVRQLVVESRRGAILTPTGMYAPMIDRGEVLGLIHVVSSANRANPLTTADLELLSGMAAPAALILQNTRMHEESLLRDRLKYDLELAAEIQRSFLPQEVISVDGIELFAEYRAAYGVGGDFYDVFWVGPDRLGVFIGDISGKGISAALMMARTSSELRAAALALVDPVAVLSAVNKAVIARQQAELFFTGIYFTLDVKTGEVLLANAGHPSPYCIHADGTVEAITAGAASAVGILDEPAFEATSFQLGHGDTIVLYTDGVIEAADARGQLYGDARLETCLLATTGGGGGGDGLPRSTNEIAEDIVRSVEQHATGVAERDDLTLFICQRSGGKRPSLQPPQRGFLSMPASPNNN